MSGNLGLDFEKIAPGDETDVSLRAYISRLPDDQLAKYDPQWKDEQVMEWDGNFRSDGALMLVCCERNVDVQEFRKVVEEYLEFLEKRKQQEK
ncbi:MAG TPA: hypothetical protein VGY77_12020 [Gemmataceae bacterium]|jgi:hypothetical protein|nr:hypothetical protein [Gemmataceae bacterium]